MNVRIERRQIGQQADKSPLYQVRIILDDREIVPSDQQRNGALDLLDLLDPPKPVAKEAPPRPA